MMLCPAAPGARRGRHGWQIEGMNQVKVNANVSELNAQKDTVRKAGVEGAQYPDRILGTVSAVPHYS